ncbi:subtilisin family serine protease [Actinoalloteichus hoggarensis]|uniref:Minor extracellular protease vpr n=1 Tax=Actinoalloteichus hoggarensis TaxID=1470176 RepID=A0A221WA18_9PSEU|nr:S8 family serine peptidase [Actinoalloteichus hoggarensis]ASO22369.1 Minor extracellular protease vpr precursor [Actinoalloteichus hoggarensis]MBB5923208.1 subtilisin family serine protease [Actinoalloteichus hoggarensis]
MSRSRRRVTRSAAAALAVVLTTGAVGSATAQDQPLAPPLPTADALSTDVGLSGVAPSLAGVQGRTGVFIELENAPAVDVFVEEQKAGSSDEEASVAAEEAKEATLATADVVVAELRVADQQTEVLYETVNAVPGVAVRADAESVRELAERSDVRSIRPLVKHELANASAVQLTNTLPSWQQTGRYGEDMRIGIIDDGVDYTHATFGGPGTPEAYDEIDRTAVDPSYFPTDKVVGGTDLVGDDYDASSDDPKLNQPRPDDNPISCGTHGTHVAGTAAGFGVNADGSTFDGDYSELDDETVRGMRIGPGTAPDALIYSIKVFGCEGSTDVTAAGLDWTLDPDRDGDFTDRLDVVNLSLGSNFGAPDDPTSLFVRKLNQHGVVTVFSGGNGGDLFDVGGSPGNTPEALTVASSRDASVVRDGAEVVAPESLAGLQPGQYSQDYPDYAGLDLTAGVVRLTDEGNLDGCDPLSSADAAAVDGKIAWLEWDDDDTTRRCGSAGRTDNASDAGAVGAIFSSGVDQFSAGIAGNDVIPVIQLTGTAVDEVRPALEAGTLEMRFAGELRTSVPTVDEDLVDTPSSFTSRGGRGPAVKPDLSAPGDTIASALSGSGDGTLVISGTSMAAPHTTGIATLLREEHPDWTPEEIKAALMNTAGADITTGPDGIVHAPNRVGSGRVDALAALDNQVLAMVEDDPGQVSVSYGTVEVDGPIAQTKTIKLINKGVRRTTMSVAYQPATEIPGVSYELDRETVTLSPRGVARVTVTLTITDPTALRKTADATLEKEQGGEARQFLADASGRIVFTPESGSTVPLRVPVHSAPKPVADIEAATWLRLPEGSEQAVLNLRGRGISQGSGDEAYRSLISVLELHATSPELPECVSDQTVGCTINRTAKGGDLRQVGATSTAPLAVLQGDPESALLAFGITTWADWYNIGSNTVPFVDIDVTGDGVPDFETYVTKYTGSDVLVAATVDLNAEGAPVVDVQPINGQLGDVDTNVFDTNVLVLPVALTALGIDPAAESAPITYTVGVSGYYAAPGDPDGLVDSIDDPISFDAVRPGLWTQGGGDAALSYEARPGTALVVNRDLETASEDGQLLVLHHHNHRGDRVQVVPTGSTPPIFVN